MKNNKPLIIITGVSSGIGAGIAKQFSNAGFSLGLIARNLKAHEHLYPSFSKMLGFRRLDFRDGRFKKGEE